MEGDADFVDVGAVGADGLVESVAGDAKLFGPEGDVGGKLGVDLLRVVRTLHGGVFVAGVRGVLFRSLFVLVFGVVMGQGVPIWDVVSDERFRVVVREVPPLGGTFSSKYVQ